MLASHVRDQLGQARPVEALLQAAHAVETEINRALAELGLTGGQFQALHALGTAPQQRLPMSAVAAATGVSRSCLTHTVERLTELGFVRRERGDRDGRRIDAVLTTAGGDVLVAALPIYAETIQRCVLDVLTPEQVSVMGAIGATLQDCGGPAPRARRPAA